MRLTGTSPTLGINAGNSIDSVFEVGGTASISGATTLRGITYTWPSADGSANQLLRTNGSGTLTWATAGVSSNSLDFDEFVDSMTLDANLTINTPSSRKIGIGAAPSTYFEIQGTASASYLLTGNTLQVGGYASAAYSRFGTGTTSHPNYITTTNDLLISGDFEVKGTASFNNLSIASGSGNVDLALLSSSATGGVNEGRFTIRSAGSSERLDILNGAGTTLVKIASQGNVTLTANLLPNAQASQSATTQVTTNIADDVGAEGNSIAIGADGFPVIAFFDVTNSNLKVVKCNNASCSSNTSNIVDGIGTITASSSWPDIAIGTDGFPVIAYYFNTTGDLLVTKCGNAACSSGNASTSLDSTNNVGQYPSIAIGRDGMPIISYYDATAGDLKTAYCTTTSCSASTLTTVDSTNDVGKHTSIKIGSDDLPIISYYLGTSGDLKVTHCGKIDCSSGNTTTALDTTNDVGQYTSIAILNSGGGHRGGPYIVYYDKTNGNLRAASCSSSACGAANFLDVDTTNDVGQYTAIAVGPDGMPIISNYDVTNSDLRIIKCSNTDRNADPCSSTVKTSVYTTNTSGKFSSIAVGPDGLPFIAFQNDNGAGDVNLLVIKCALPDCSQTTGGGFNNTGSDVGSIGLFFRNIYAAQYWGKKFQIANFDIAEEYLDDPSTSSGQASLEPGDVVSLTGRSSFGIERATASSSYPILGIISTSPAVVLGDWGKAGTPSNAKPVALSGRTPVKISDENGSIKAGDRLTLSKTLPGYAMKMTEPGQSIGIALENFESGIENCNIENSLKIENCKLKIGQILTFVNLSYWIPSISELATSDWPLENEDLEARLPSNGLFAYILNQFKKIGVIFENGIVRAKEFIAEKITAKQIKTEELCVDDICVTREKFRQVFGESEPANTPAPSESPIPSPEPELSPESTDDGLTTPNQTPLSGDGTGQTSEDQGTSDVTEPSPEPTPESTPEPVQE
ncbi:MAG: procyclic acidic repetitive family protein [Parcubacteria group bacterium]|nr:procyclic acidic repetitive family protein [Parcubacteria group bacterium]